MEKPVCKNCNQLVFDLDGKPTHKCILKGYIEDIEKNWCRFYNAHWIKKEEKEKND